MINEWNRSSVIHPLVVRVCHWLNAIAIFIMVLSGWRIYNAAPIFPFSFPPTITLGGWLGGALLWHFAAMWLLVANGLVYLFHGLVSGHYRRDFLPLSVGAIAHELGNVLRGRLSHAVGSYNALQKSAYLTVILLMIVLVLSGLSIWKPVQFQEIASLMGGYEGARRVHFFAMAGVVGFILIHVTMVALVPRTFLPMFTGRAATVSAREKGA
jgi:thiosulfate reductase cytochrome b subunit